MFVIKEMGLFLALKKDQIWLWNILVSFSTASLGGKNNEYF